MYLYRAEGIPKGEHPREILIHHLILCAPRPYRDASLFVRDNLRIDGTVSVIILYQS